MSFSVYRVVYREWCVHIPISDKIVQAAIDERDSTACHNIQCRFKIRVLAALGVSLSFEELAAGDFTIDRLGRASYTSYYKEKAMQIFQDEAC
jgi:hypothetical protein